MTSPNYITPQGFARLKAELHRLLTEDRPEVVRVVSWAASNGDRSENGDYIYGKRRLREIDSKIRHLQKRLEIAEVIDVGTPGYGWLEEQKTWVVRFGAHVTYQDLESEETRTIHIVGTDEIDASQGKISWQSPLARACLNQKSGAEVTVVLPQGPIDIEIRNVEYRAQRESLAT